MLLKLSKICLWASFKSYRLTVSSTCSNCGSLLQDIICRTLLIDPREKFRQATEHNQRAENVNHPTIQCSRVISVNKKQKTRHFHCSWDRFTFYYKRNAKRSVWMAARNNRLTYWSSRHPLVIWKKHGQIVKMLTVFTQARANPSAERLFQSAAITPPKSSHQHATQGPSPTNNTETRTRSSYTKYTGAKRAEKSERGREKASNCSGKGPQRVGECRKR